MQHHFAVIEHAGILLGNAVPDVELAEILRHPAPALHVYQDALPFLVDAAAAAAAGRLVQRGSKPPVDDAGNCEPMLFLVEVHRLQQSGIVCRLFGSLPAHPQTLANKRDLAVVVAGPKIGTRRYACGRTAARTFAEGEKRLAEPPELLVLRMQSAQIGVRGFRGGYALEHGFRLKDVGAPVDDVADRGRVQPAASCISRIFQHGEAQLDLRFGQRLGRCGCAWRGGKLEGGCVQAPIVRIANFMLGFEGSGVEAFLGDPNGLPLVLGIEGFGPIHIFAVIRFSTGLGGVREDLRGNGIGFWHRCLRGFGRLCLLGARRFWRRAIRLGRRQRIGRCGIRRRIQGYGRSRFYSFARIILCRNGSSASGGCCIQSCARPRFRLARILRHRQRHRASEASRDAYAKHCPCNHTDPLLPLARYAIRKMLGFFFP